MVNFRSIFSVHQPVEGSIEAQVTRLAELQQKGLIRHIGLSNVTSAQIAEARRIVPIVCVQNQYNIAQRADDALVADLARDGIAYVPFFPLGGFSPLQSGALTAVAARLMRRRCRLRLLGCSTLAKHPGDSRNIFSQSSSRESEGGGAQDS